MSKYKNKYALQLKRGLRKDGKSIEECCSLWGITTKTYYNWIKTIPKFAEAAEIGEQDKTSWWRIQQRLAATGEIKGNAGVINLALKNEAGYVDKQEIEHKHEEQITTIRIERIESTQPRIIEHVRTENLLDGQSS